LIQIYLDRQKLRWPSVYVFCLLLALMLLFFPLKNIGQLAQEGENVTVIVDTSKESINTALVAEAPDQQFLDQFACALTLIDDAGRFYYGATYLNILTLPIPRQWWPEKPTVADYLQEISTPSRPIKEASMIVTFLGESYVNFGYFGIVLLPGVVAYCLARVYFRAYRSNYFSVARFAYLLVACNLIQVYRDGLVSIVIFTWVNMMPLMVIVLLHWILPTKPRNRNLLEYGQVGYQNPSTTAHR